MGIQKSYSYGALLQKNESPKTSNPIEMDGEGVWHWYYNTDKLETKAEENFWDLLKEKAGRRKDGLVALFQVERYGREEEKIASADTSHPCISLFLSFVFLHTNFANILQLFALLFPEHFIANSPQELTATYFPFVSYRLFPTNV
jgi:hypothetical protein